jgi:hypothetical protein
VCFVAYAIAVDCAERPKYFARVMGVPLIARATFSESIVRLDEPLAVLSGRKNALHTSVMFSVK